MSHRDYTFFLFTLGCKINQYETQAIREAWLQFGWQEMENPEQAGIIVINSCAVTARAVQDIRKMTRRFYRQNPLAKILIVGCAARPFAGELSSLPGVSAVVPQESKSALLDQTQVKNCLILGDTDKDKVFVPDKDSLGNFCISSYPRARPVLKVEDGCSRFCTYCIVPYTRGKPKSRSGKSIWQEVQRLVTAGFQEIIVSGINLAQFSFDGQGDFWDLIYWLNRELERHFGQLARLRLSSLDPILMQDKALRVLEQSGLVCPHIHISLQSASAGVLRRMGRAHTSRQGLESFLAKLSSIWPDFGFGVDLLTGFPGETEEEFQETLSFCRQMPLTYGHVFTFSSRPGTKAAQMDGRVPKAVKKDRSLALRQVLAKKKMRFLNELSQKGQLELIVEQEQPCLGLCQYYTLCWLEDEQVFEPKGSKILTNPLYYQDKGLVVQKAFKANKPLKPCQQAI